LANQTKDKKKGNVDPSYYTVFPDKVPYKGSQLPKEINIGETLEFRFTLPDKFYNLL
jgi:hypothetical protein